MTFCFRRCKGNASVVRLLNKHKAERFADYQIAIQNTSTTSDLVFHIYSQQDATFLNLFTCKDSLHVSDGSSARHQEHITVHTASGIVNQYRC
jgi:hypothetical protein